WESLALNGQVLDCPLTVDARPLQRALSADRRLANNTLNDVRQTQPVKTLQIHRSHASRKLQTLVGSIECQVTSGCSTILSHGEFGQLNHRIRIPYTGADVADGISLNLQ